MSTAPSLGRVVSKFPPTRALRCLKPFSSRPLAPIRFIRDQSNMAKPLLRIKPVYPIIPSVESERESETPSMTVLSKLNVVGIGRDEPETKKVNYLLTRHLACQAQEAQRQQRLGGLLMENDGITVTHVPFREGGSELGWSQQYSELESNRTMEEDGSPGSDGQIPDGYGRDGFGRGGGDYDGGREERGTRGDGGSRRRRRR